MNVKSFPKAPRTTKTVIHLLRETCLHGKGVLRDGMKGGGGIVTPYDEPHKGFIEWKYDLSMRERRKTSTG